MPTLAQIHTDVSTRLRRGTTLDSLIPAAVRRSARQIERNYTLQYMQRFVSFSIANRSIATPDTAFKRIDFMQLVLDDGELADVAQIDPRELTLIESGQPSQFWIDAFDYFWFDKTPDETYSAQMSYARFTSWPTDTSQTPWLAEHADDLLVCKALQNLRFDARFPPQLIADLEDQEKELMSELIRADEELKQSARNEVMNYGVLS